MPRRWIQVCRVVGVAAAVAVALSSITPAAAQYLDPGRAWTEWNWRAPQCAGAVDRDVRPPGASWIERDAHGSRIDTC
jgi:hypothetical protein